MTENEEFQEDVINNTGLYSEFIDWLVASIGRSRDSGLLANGAYSCTSGN